ncbi:MAG TPA: transposase [Bacteroidia bacterium]|nr:transposase [Bacteroidia bacterium]HOZ89877.1 transposase [Bacteroidia bacterium]HQW18830.1 transposase [Bacteroidia bacterium]HQW50180.1 transposase [Bacteroidia bacterium]HQX69593.1 transposase [Bacteroidia bacterium]
MSLDSKLRSLAFHHQEYLNIGTTLRAYCKKHYTRDYNLLRSIPGIGGFLASAVIAECGDLRRFANEKQFSSYIGVVPGIYSSGGNETMLGVTPRSKSLLRTYIIESAWVALRYDQEIQAYYRKHASKNPKSVIVKIAHKMVKRMLSVIKNGQPYRVNNTINKLKEEKEKQ